MLDFLVAEITPVGFDTIKYRYYIIYAVINAAIIPTVYFCFPETNGRSLEEMDEIFAKSKNVFDPPRIAKSLPRRQPGQRVADTEKSVVNGSYSTGMEDGKDTAQHVENTTFGN